MQSHESQLAVVAIASAAFGYWLATGLPLPPARSIPGASSGSPLKAGEPIGSATAETKSVAEVSPSTAGESTKKNKKKNKAKQQAAKDDATKAAAEGELDAGSDSEDEKAAVTEASLDQVKPGKWEECKLVLVVNQELGMGKGKIAAQCGHATLACYKTLVHQNPKLLSHWEQTGQAKVAVKCTSTAELLKLQSEARALNLCARSIQDAGRTQIAAGSRTVLGIGPGPIKLVNQVTGHLKLL
ncbi:hypothetical protein NliqN6_1773 [Naganishia liquefaciens]|uniref:peptidyl-tRNA hydrolase n=1 Tax=Naganishia liquefaciens TaxID=104408 RepID=A0A8H3TR08_9TREE|nr:hypothetical protein NliqN6_1773 [Naganishia liquefaciens]